MENSIHIGRMIKTYIDRKNITRVSIAKAMNTPSTAIYAFEKRTALNSATILKISNALRYNFFMDIANTLPTDFEYNQAGSTKDVLIQQQVADIQKLQHENALLKELIMGKK
jgi:hypothetical protein